MSNTNDDALDTILQFVDMLMSEGRVEVIDAVCRSWPLDSGLDQVLAVLTSTLPLRSLPGRELLLQKAKKHFRVSELMWSGL